MFRIESFTCIQLRSVIFCESITVLLFCMIFNTSILWHCNNHLKDWCTMNKYATKLISQCIIESNYSDIPQNILVKAKYCVLDLIGCALGGRKTKIADILIKSVTKTGLGISTIFGENNLASLNNAVFINSSLSNILDYDDTSIGHPGSTVIPVAFNLGEILKSSGKEILLAIVLGYEISLRLGLALRPKTERKYVHGHGTWGTFGSTVVSGKLLQLDKEKMANALGIAGANAPVRSVMKTSNNPEMSNMVKNNFGIAAEIGMKAAFLAKNEFQGPIDIFEGDTGFWRMIGTDKIELYDFLLEDMIKNYLILDVGFKFYPCCRLIHSSIDAITEILDKNSIDIYNIKKISIYSLTPLSQKPFSKAEPKNMIEGQFSVPYSIACAVYKINLLDWYLDNNLSDNKLLNFAKKISINPELEADELHKKDCSLWLSRVEVYTDNNKYSNKVLLPKGIKTTSYDLEDLKQKFINSAVRSIKNENKVNQLLQIILNLEEIKDINEVTKLLY